MNLPFVFNLKLIRLQGNIHFSDNEKIISKVAIFILKLISSGFINKKKAMFPEELDFFFWFQRGIEMYSRNYVAMQLCWFNGDRSVSLSETVSLRWK